MSYLPLPVPTYLQFRLLLNRGLTTYWRLPAYNVLRLIVTLVLGIFFGTLYLNKGEKMCVSGV